MNEQEFENKINQTNEDNIAVEKNPQEDLTQTDNEENIASENQHSQENNLTDDSTGVDDVGSDGESNQSQENENSSDGTQIEAVVVEDSIHEDETYEDVVVNQNPMEESDDENNLTASENQDDTSGESQIVPVEEDGKLIISRKYDLTSKEAIKNATKILEENRESKAKRECPWKKLPQLFRKSYSEKALKRKILKKIYIPEDRRAVAALFQLGAYEKAPEKLSVPRDLLFTKKEIKRYKKLAKEVKSQSKLRIRLIPLAAVVAVIVFAVSWVMANKNRLVRNLIVNTCQGIFKAKTDVDYVSVKILDLSITVGGLKVGNKDSVMKNLFEVNRIQLDFDLVQLLKKRFVCENLEASGIAWNTDRKTSCYLPQTPKAESAFSREVKARFNNALNDLKNQAYDLLGGSDVESIIANVQKNINTPELVEKTISDMNLLYEKWKDKPAEYEKKITDFTDSVKDLQTINLTQFDIRNPEDLANLKDALEKIQAAIEQGKTLGLTVQQAVNDVKTDGESVALMAKNVTSTVKSDYDYIVNRLTTVVGTLANLNGLLNNALNTIAYNMLGKYYPYVMDGLEYARSMKSSSNENKKPKKEKTSKRSPGTDFYFTPACPSFLIKNVKVSGTGFDCVIKEIANNQNVRNIPTTANLTLEIKDIVHKGNVTVDVRKNSSAPLVSVGYTGEGYEVGIDGASIASMCGVPSINGKALLSISGTAERDGFSAQGAVDLSPVSLSTDGFENELVTKYYRVGLESVDRLNFGFDFGYKSSSGLYLNLNGNFAEQFTNALKNVVMEIGKDAKQAALKKLEELLNNSENEVLAKVKEFLGIQGDIDLQNMTLSDAQNLLLAKKTEIENKINGKVEEVKKEVTEKVEEKINDVKQQATAVVEEKVNEAKQNVTDSITNAITSGLGIQNPKDKSDSDEEEEKDEESNSNDALNALGGFLKGWGH